MYDALVIPGGGVREGGNVPPWVQNRLDRAITLFQDQYIIALSAGTVHKPPLLDAHHFPIFEARAGAQYLVSKGIPPEHILCETSSYDTIGNAYFCRVIHTEPLGLKHLLIITSAFHMARTQSIFKWVFGLPYHPDHASTYQLTFETVPDINDGLSTQAIQSRTEKEQKGLLHLAHLQKKLYTLPDFHRWLFTEHGAYAISTPPIRLQGSIVSTY